MTRSDKWKGRDCVVRYWKYKDELREKNVVLPDKSHVIFTMPMPDSWSEKKKREHDGMPHRSKPDVDNLCKGILDCLYDDDSSLHDLRITKLWGIVGSIEIKPLDS